MLIEQLDAANRLPDNQNLTEQLQSAVKEYNSQPHTPELVTKFWHTFLETSIKRQRLDIPVSAISCDRTPEDLETLKRDGRMWVPETKLTPPQLDTIFPIMGFVVQKGSPIEDKYDQDAKGVDVETSIYSPNQNNTQEDLEKLFRSQGRNGMRPSTYVLSSQASKVLTGHYLDEGRYWSRLLGSRGLVSVGFHPIMGSLRVGWHLPKRLYPFVGGRSEGVKKA